MKKNLRYIFLTLILTFIGLNGVRAADLTCTYKLNSAGVDMTIQCTIPCNATKPSCKKTSGTSIHSYDGNNSFRIENFDQGNNCPKKIYYGVGNNSTGTGSSVINVNGTSGTYSATLSKETNAKKCSSSKSTSTDSFAYPGNGYTLNIILNHSEKTLTASINGNACTNHNLNDKKNGKKGFDYDKFVAKYTNGCPAIHVYQSTLNKDDCDFYLTQNSSSGKTHIGKISCDENAVINDSNGNNQNSGNKKTIVEEEIGTDYLDSCDDLGDTLTLIKQVYNFLRYIIPVLIIILSIVDFVRVILNLNDDGKDFKQAWTKLIKRLIVGAIILILPALLSMFVSISNISSEGSSFFCIFE